MRIITRYKTLARINIFESLFKASGFCRPRGSFSVKAFFFSSFEKKKKWLMELIEIKVIYLFDAEQPFHNEPNVSVITDIIGL